MTSCLKSSSRGEGSELITNCWRTQTSDDRTARICFTSSRSLTIQTQQLVALLVKCVRTILWKHIGHNGITQKSSSGRRSAWGRGSCSISALSKSGLGLMFRTSSGYRRLEWAKMFKNYFTLRYLAHYIISSHLIYIPYLSVNYCFIRVPKSISNYTIIMTGNGISGISTTYEVL